MYPPCHHTACPGQCCTAGNDSQHLRSACSNCMHVSSQQALTSSRHPGSAHSTQEFADSCRYMPAQRVVSQPTAALACSPPEIGAVTQAVQLLLTEHAGPAAHVKGNDDTVANLATGDFWADLQAGSRGCTYMQQSLKAGTEAAFASCGKKALAHCSRDLMPVCSSSIAWGQARTRAGSSRAVHAGRRAAWFCSSSWARKRGSAVPIRRTRAFKRHESLHVQNERTFLTMPMPSWPITSAASGQGSTARTSSSANSSTKHLLWLRCRPHTSLLHAGEGSSVQVQVAAAGTDC